MSWKTLRCSLMMKGVRSFIICASPSETRVPDRKVSNDFYSGQSTISGGRSPTRQIQGRDTYDSEEDTGLSVAGVSSQVQWVPSSPDSCSDNMIQDGGDDDNAYDGEEDNNNNGPTKATRPIKQDRQNKTSRILMYDLLGQLLVDSHNGSGRPNS